MNAQWFETKIPVIGKIGTPLLFDVGVYLLVLGISLKIIFSLFEEDEQ
jgi:multicomponent Na+:H+ antiporter subunit B